MPKYALDVQHLPARHSCFRKPTTKGSFCKSRAMDPIGQVDSVFKSHESLSGMKSVVRFAPYSLAEGVGWSGTISTLARRSCSMDPALKASAAPAMHRR